MRIWGGIAVLMCLGTPALADSLRPLCPDQPGKNTSPCTVDAGHFQLELDLYDQTFERRGGIATDTLLAFNPTLKYGLGDTLDIEASFASIQTQRVKTSTSNIITKGQGDLYIRGKWMVTGDGGAGFTAVFEPFAKLATASRGLGNGALEGGLQIPFGYDWGNGWSLSTTPEADALLDASGHGRHAALVDAVELNEDLPGGFTLGAEVWTSQNLDPAGAVSQYSADFDLAWLKDDNTQLAGGMNLGLNRATPDLEVYVGVSERF